MLSKSLPFLSSILRWNLAQPVEQFSFCRGSRQSLPSALTLEDAPREALLPRDSEDLSPRVAEMAFDVIVRPRQAGQLVTVKEAGPIALAQGQSSDMPFSRWRPNS